jgi:hypothetical protein
VAHDNGRTLLTISPNPTKAWANDSFNEAVDGLLFLTYDIPVIQVAYVPQTARRLGAQGVTRP